MCAEEREIEREVRCVRACDIIFPCVTKTSLKFQLQFSSHLLTEYQLSFNIVYVLVLQTHKDEVSSQTHPSFAPQCSKLQHKPEHFSMLGILRLRPSPYFMCTENAFIPIPHIGRTPWFVCLFSRMYPFSPQLVPQEFLRIQKGCPLLEP